MGEGSLKTQKFRSVDLERNGEVTQEVIYEHLRRLFNVAEISEEARAVLRNLVLLPEGGMDIGILEAAMGEDGLELVEQLIDHGWLTFDEDTKFVTIHPVVRLVCREELKPDDENCGTLLDAIPRKYDHEQYNSIIFCQLAELYSQAALILQDKLGGWAHQAGYFWEQVGKLQKALDYYLKSTINGENSIAGSEEIATTYNNVGNVFARLGKYEQAIEFHRKALAIRKVILPAEHPDLADSYNSIGGAYDGQGEYKNAIENMMKALAIREKTLQPDHPDLANSYNSVGGFYAERGDYKKALGYLLKAMKIREKILSSDHPTLAISYNNVGSAYVELGDYEESMRYLLKAIKIQEKVLPLEHPDLANTYNNLGNVYGILGDRERALEYLLKSLDVQEKSLPKNHPNIATACGNIAAAFLERGQYYKAMNYSQRAIQVAKQYPAGKHPHMDELRQIEKIAKSFIKRR